MNLDGAEDWITTGSFMFAYNPVLDVGIMIPLFFSVSSIFLWHEDPKQEILIYIYARMLEFCQEHKDSMPPFNCTLE